MTRKAYLQQLMARNKLYAYIQELQTLTELEEVNYYHSTSLILMSRYNELSKDIMGGMVSSAERILRTNQLRSNALSLEKTISAYLTQIMNEEVDSAAINAMPLDSVTEHKMPTEEPSQTISYHIQGENVIVGSGDQIQGENVNVISGNQNTVEVNQTKEGNEDIRTHLNHIQQLVEAGEQEGFITRSEYEELLDILEEIKEISKPNERQEKRWKRWIGRAAEVGRKFLGGRAEKITDHGLKEWFDAGGQEMMEGFLHS
ncbi:MAG: hypothetical protein AAF587_27325 [Bacteroidota bacterium]